MWRPHIRIMIGVPSTWRKQVLLRLVTNTALLFSVTAFASADLIVVNADVYTVDPAAPRVQAFAVEDGRFTAVGSNAEIQAFADSDTRIIDAA